MAIDFNDREHRDDGLLEEARMAASTDWEEEFVADLIARRKRYGAGFELTDRQREKLGEIVDPPERDERWNRR
jgi:hypothetical protein